MRMVDIEGILGDRVLIRYTDNKYNTEDVIEVKFIELSLDKVWVKLMNPHGHKVWRSIFSMTLVAELKQFKPGERK